MKAGLCCEFRSPCRPRHRASASESLHQYPLAALSRGGDSRGSSQVRSGSECLPISKNKNAEQMPSCRRHLPASLLEVFSQACNIWTRRIWKFYIPEFSRSFPNITSPQLVRINICLTVGRRRGLFQTHSFSLLWYFIINILSVSIFYLISHTNLVIYQLSLYSFFCWMCISVAFHLHLKLYSNRQQIILKSLIGKQ